MNKQEFDIEIIKDKSFFGFLKDKRVIVSICIVVVIAVIVTLLFFVFRSNKSALNKELENIGRNFYENYYYDQAGKDDNERKAFLAQFTTAGIKVDLDNLARASKDKDEILNKFVNKKTGEKCNEINTKVVIYPIEPYNKTDYKIDVAIDCGFSK